MVCVGDYTLYYTNINPFILVISCPLQSTLLLCLSETAERITLFRGNRELRGCVIPRSLSSCILALYICHTHGFYMSAGQRPVRAALARKPSSQSAASVFEALG